jgi:hypothetical protein
VIPTPEYPTQLLSYALGEDVIVRLDGVDVLDTDHMAVLPRPFVPEWTIARIVSFVLRDGCFGYLVRAEVCDHPCLCVVDDAAIDGVA